MAKVNAQIDEAIEAVKEEDFLRALTIFLDVYGSDDAVPSNTKAAAGLSYFGVCLALVQKKYKPAIELCKRAIALQFYSPDHYVNLAKVYAAAGNRKKAVETAEQGLKQHPEHEGLLAVRRSLGIRARPAVPFLDRAHPINVSLGQSRHAKKISETERKKK